jgi:hypothetical protein
MSEFRRKTGARSSVATMLDPPSVANRKTSWLSPPDAGAVPLSQLLPVDQVPLTGLRHTSSAEARGDSAAVAARLRTNNHILLRDELLSTLGDMRGSYHDPRPSARSDLHYTGHNAQPSRTQGAIPIR